MALDIIQFLQDYGVDFATRGKNISKDFIGVNCPDCPHDTDYHLGISKKGTFAKCWRCGIKQIPDLVTIWLGVSHAEAKRLLLDYGGYSSVADLQSEGLVDRPTTIDIPGSTLTKHHRAYLEERDFDPDYLVDKYSLRGTGPSYFYGQQDFSLSIIIPVYNRRKQLISFQARSISDWSDVRYKGLKEEESVKHYKETLYGLNNTKSDTVVLVEGVTDVWRGGDDFLCTFGTSLKPSQLRELSGLKRVVILFDDEPEAQEKAVKYGKDLCCTGIEVDNWCLEMDGKDVGDLTTSEVMDLRVELGLNKSSIK